MLAFSDQYQNLRWTPNFNDLSLISEGSFAIALIYVSYAYTGWNAATYLAGEVEGVQKEMPRVLIQGH